MNYFNFEFNDAFMALVYAYFSGVTFGLVILGVIRFLLLDTTERKE